MLSQEAEIVVVPGIMGELAILPRHAPLLTALQSGEIMVRNDNKESYLAVSGGFIEVMPRKVTILANTAEHAEEIDEQRAEEALIRAKNLVESAPRTMDLERALASMRKSQTRLRTARRRRHQGQI